MRTQRPLRQALQPDERTGEDLQTYQMAATEQYPDETPSGALEKYARDFRVPGLFFRDDEGVRCTWGADIEDKSGRYDKKKQVRVDDRHYLIRSTPKTLKQIDKPRPTLYHNLVAHPSENQWARTDGHPLHFNKFPQEIKNSILCFALTASREVMPSTVRSNWKTNYCQPHYEICGEPKHSETSHYSSIVWMRRYDRDGKFFEMREVKKPAIDATLLRTCKDFYNNGILILYGKNVFAFEMNDYSYRQNPFTLVGNSIQFRPAPEKPVLRSTNWDAEVQEGIIQTRLGRPVEMLTGWVYFDPFLPFLRTIGTDNTAMLKHLTFTGVVKLHECSWSECTRCEQDLVMGLRLYIPFITNLCTGLEKLTITCLNDQVIPRYGRDPGDPSPATCEEALRPLLENELRQIRTLVNLEVINVQFVTTGEHGAYEFRRAGFAIPSIDWFRKQDNRAPDQKEHYLEEVADEPKKITCDFCGENHVWAECYNLCGFCGRYDHFRSTCTTLHAIYEEQMVPIHNRY